MSLKNRVCYLTSILSLLLVLTVSVQSATFYVDSRTGSDSNTGQSELTAWKSLERINRATEIKPGDKILFVRGGLWRGVLKPKSGEEGKPVLYGAFGNGPLPKIYGSVDASQKSDWYEVQSGIWGTRKVETVVGNSFGKTDNGFGNGAWNLHFENGAKASISGKGTQLAVNCITGGTQTNHIQVWGPVFSGKLPEDGLLVTYRAKSSKTYQMPGLTIQLSSYPYSSWFSGAPVEQLGPEWKEFKVFLVRNNMGVQPEKKDLLRLHLALGSMPSDCKLELELLDMCEASIDRTKQLYCDIGNIIFDHGTFTKGHRCGIKKWKISDLKKPGDYFYDPKEEQVLLRWDGNPANDCFSIELAKRDTIINQNGCHDIVYENLAVAYGAAHGFGGGNTQRIVIRKGDIYYIGGGHQFTQPNGVPVRFGNGIEFWGSAADCLVEENRLWEIYDAALTNQGKGNGTVDRSIERNIIYRKNIIWNAEYSFEYWNGDKDQITENILFEDNICWDAGFCWSHGQRPNPNGAHLMFYNNPAQTKNFVVRNNVFSESTEVCIRMENDWLSALTLEGNRYYQSEKPLIRWRDAKTGKPIYFEKDDLVKIQQTLHIEKNGIIEKFNPPKQDIEYTQK